MRHTKLPIGLKYLPLRKNLVQPNWILFQAEHLVKRTRKGQKSCFQSKPDPLGCWHKQNQVINTMTLVDWKKEGKERKRKKNSPHFLLFSSKRWKSCYHKREPWITMCFSIGSRFMYENTPTRSGKEAIEDRMCNQRFRALTIQFKSKRWSAEVRFAVIQKVHQHCTHRKHAQSHPKRNGYHYVPNTINVWDEPQKDASDESGKARNDVLLHHHKFLSPAKWKYYFKKRTELKEVTGSAPRSTPRSSKYSADKKTIIKIKTSTEKERLTWEKDD